MASTTVVAIEVVHVAAAMVVVGYFAFVPMWKAAASKSGDSAVLRFFLRTSQTTEQRVVLPALVLLLFTGLALVLGPFAVVQFARARWAWAAIGLTILAGVFLVMGLGGPVRKMIPLVEAGESTGPAMDKLWGDWRTAAISGAIVTLVALAMMVYQGSL